MLLIPLRISHPKVDKLACQTQGADIFAEGEISPYDAYCVHFTCISISHENRKSKRFFANDSIFSKKS